MNTDLVTMIGNVSRSFSSIKSLVVGLAYLLGLLFFMISVQKFKQIAEQRAGSSSHESMFVPTAYLLGGAALIFLPSMTSTLANSVFGVSNILQYATYNPYDVVSSMIFIIRVVGVIWFVRGCVLMVHASEPGVQHGKKGLMFLMAGILAMNFESTTAWLNWVASEAMTYSSQSSSNSDT